jgi:hypothetical protein
MTYTLIPFRETKPPNASKLHEGPYYGRQLRRILTDEGAPVSWVDRITDYYMVHTWPAAALLVLGCAMLGAAIVLATWMVM